MRRRAILPALVALVLAGVGGGCGQDKTEPTDTPGNAERQPQPCESRPPSSVDDGTNDDQGGSTPGTNPCHGPGS